jgi:hypothetical protein
MAEVELRPEQKDEPLKNDRMTITIELERIYDPQRTKNNLMMTMESVSLGDDDGKLVGEVLHGIPAHTVIRDAETKEDWVLNYGVLFTAYHNARKEFKEEKK